MLKSQTMEKKMSDKSRRGNSNGLHIYGKMLDFSNNQEMRIQQE